MELLFFPFVVIVAFPPLAYLPGLGFGLCYWRRRRYAPRGAKLMILGTAILWLAYAVYETVMYVWMKTVIAPIRIDLLLIAPFLYVVTVIGVVACWRAGRGTRVD